MDESYGRGLQGLVAKLKAQKLILKEAKASGDKMAQKRAEKEIKRLAEEIDRYR